MKSMSILKSLIIAVLTVLPLTAISDDRIVTNGVPWYDTDGNIINAHGACIVEDGGRYWLFGEYKSDESNAFPGFGCYSSDDLVTWRFERVVLPVQKDGILGPNRVGERVKVMKCPSTGEYVMLMHADDMKYTDPHVGIATCSTINGDYTLQGSLEYEGKPLRHWDLGTFQDTDGTGYLLIHHGPIYRLSDDYRSVDAKVAHVEGAGESPAMFKQDGTYYLLYSNLTSWERNDNFYFTAPSIEGPWIKQGLFCPEGSLTYNSQSTFVFPLKCGGKVVNMFMGDRWSYPHQASAATYVWLPLQADGTKLSIPKYWQSWDVDKVAPVNLTESGNLISASTWVCNEKGKRLTVPFTGKNVAIIGESNRHGGYATVSVKDNNDKYVYSSLVDFYSKTPDHGIRIITPEMEEGNYTLEVEVSGENPVWYNKAGDRYGSDDSFVTISQVYSFN